MGVESKFYVLMNESGFRPDPEAVCSLVEGLREAKFLCDARAPGFNPQAHRMRSAREFPEHDGFEWSLGRDRIPGMQERLEELLEANQERDIRFRWPTLNLALSGLRYPLTIQPGPSEELYYDIEIHLAAKTVDHSSEILDGFYQTMECTCGAEIKSQSSAEEIENDADPFYASRLPNSCPKCGQVFNFASVPTTARDPWTGEESSILGGCAYRFAVVVDCGKYYPDTPEATVLPEFLAIIERTLGVQTRVVRDFY